MKSPPINAINIKPIMYPPVGPNKAVPPLFAPANTGSPTRPRSTYISTAKAPFFAPST